MDLKGVLSISGQPGLYKLVSQARNSIIVESLEDKKRLPAYASSKISSLEDIAIYTVNEDILLHDVFKKIFERENGNVCPINGKADSNAIKKYFGEVLPEHDKDRVYVSDMKRVLVWYNILHKNGLLNFDEPENTVATENVEVAEKIEETT